MEIDVSARHFHVSEALKDYITEKIKKLQKYALKIETVHVVLEVQKFHHISEITASGKNLRLTAKEESADMYAAFDKSLDNIQLRLGRQHDKVKDHKVRHNKKATETVAEED